MIELKIYRTSPKVKVPYHASEGAAGLDLQSTEDRILAPGERALLGTGVAMAIPEGYVGLMCPRSGLAHKHGISLVNSPGVVDCDYRGELKANVINLGQEDFNIAKGDRIAQLVIVPYLRVDLVDCVSDIEELPKTKRGQSGHGSTGVN